MYSVRGFTLVELMIVVVVIAILGSIAVPSYRSYVLRAQRTDATAALLRVRTVQEKFFLQNNRYMTNAELTSAPPVGIGMATSENGYYTLQTAPGGGITFTATATPAPAGPQAADSKCQTFTIDDLGQRTSGPDPVTTCWK